MQTQTFVRSKRKPSILICFYLSILNYTIIGLSGLVLVGLLAGKGLEKWDYSLLLPCVAILSLFFALVEKGSLVESVVIDFEQKVVRVFHYQLPCRKCERCIPFDGLHWNTFKPGRGSNRLKISPSKGRSVVICENYLGWEKSVLDKMQYALDKAVNNDKTK